MKIIYYKSNMAKVLSLLFNTVIFIVGIVINDPFYTAFALFLSLISVQLHFFVFEDTSDTNNLNRIDLFVSITSLFILSVIFILRSAAQ